eukprot:m51a1_g9065 hypothetical protein (160) ;mRNA; r:87718-88614
MNDAQLYTLVNSVAVCAFLAICAYHRAYVTLATDAEYFMGALVVQQTLASSGAQHPLVAMVTPDARIPDGMQALLVQRGGHIARVDDWDPGKAQQVVLERNLEPHCARWDRAFTKLRALQLGPPLLSPSATLVWLDADAVVYGNLDPLFDLAVVRQLCK